MIYPAESEILELHRRLVEQTGGILGLRDVAAFKSSVSQPFQTFGGADLYPSIEAKAAALGYFLISNHPFLDGNKRIGHAAMELTLVLNGLELVADVDEQERIVLAVASGKSSREAFAEWVVSHTTKRS